MSSAWGASFGSAWGNAWGNLGVVIPPPGPDFFQSGLPRPAVKPSRLRRSARASVWLTAPCTVSASAGLRIGASVAVDAENRAKSEAGLRLPASAEIAIQPSVKAEADMHDVVLEMLLMLD